MNTKTKQLHAARLKNNCPECFGSDGLEFKFFQTEKETLFFKKSSPKQEQLYCHTCENEIYPVRWDEDIERVYDYHQKIANSHMQLSKTKPILWALILIICLALIVAIYFIFA